MAAREAQPRSRVWPRRASPTARTALARYQRRLAAALAGVINLLDPDVIVLGGGLSSIASLYAQVPKLWAPLTVAAAPRTRLAPARFGPESGLRGAAWLGRPARARSQRRAAADSPR